MGIEKDLEKLKELIPVLEQIDNKPKSGLAFGLDGNDATEYNKARSAVLLVAELELGPNSSIVQEVRNLTTTTTQNVSALLGHAIALRDKLS